MSRKKTTVVCIIETLGRGGGAEHLLANLAQPLRARGVEVIFVDLFSWPDDLGIELEQSGFVVHRLRSKGKWGLLTGILRVRALARSKGAHVVWGHLYFGNIVASLLARTSRELVSVVTFHSSSMVTGNRRWRLKARIAAALDRTITAWAHEKVAVSNAVRNEYLIARAWNGIRVIPNGVDARVMNTEALPVASRQEVRASYRWSDSDYVIVVPARFVPEKGHDVLLEALSRLAILHGTHPVALLVGLHTPLVDALRDRCRKLGLDDRNVRFRAPVAQAELHRLMHAADLMVLPSRHEAFGLAAIEAMATGAPVILSRVGGMAEIDPDETSVVYVPPGDSEALCEAIARCMSDPAGETIRARAGQKLAVERFGLQRCADAWAELLKQAELIAKRRNDEARVGATGACEQGGS